MLLRVRHRDRLWEATVPEQNGKPVLEAWVQQTPAPGDYIEAYYHDAGLVVRLEPATQGQEGYNDTDWFVAYDVE